jgi:hypothetical protein
MARLERSTSQRAVIERFQGESLSGPGLAYMGAAVCGIGPTVRLNGGVISQVCGQDVPFERLCRRLIIPIHADRTLLGLAVPPVNI